MKETKNIPFRNYIILSVILILSVVGVVYFYMWYDELKMNSINTPVMNNYLSVINYNEIETYLVENKNVILYVSSLNDENTRKFEKKFKRIIRKYGLKKEILYLDLTNNKSLNNIIQNFKLTSMPCIIVFEDGIVNDVYSIKDFNYDIDLIVDYLKMIGVIYD